MIRRFLCLLSAVLVCTSSVFAWSAESFVDDGAPYELAPVSSPLVSMYSSGVYATSSDDASSGYDSAGDPIYLLGEGSTIVPSITGSYTVARPYTMYIPATEQTILMNQGQTTSPALSSASPGNVYFTTVNNFPNISNTGGVTHSNIGVPGMYDSNAYIQFDFSVDGSFKSVELSWLLNSVYFGGLSSSLGAQSPLIYVKKVELLINGVVVQTFSGSGSYSNSGYLYNSVNPITSIGLRMSASNLEYFYEAYRGTFPTAVGNNAITDYRPYFRAGFVNGNFFAYNVIDSGALDMVNDQAQDAINEHESVESQWTGSMTENFNKLDISNFTFPVGLVSGFGLLTGIFQDLWNGMGEYKILYVFPLTLGIVLLLVGRISKFAGRSGSSKSDRGDGGA